MFGTPGLDRPGGCPAAAKGIPEEGPTGIVGEDDVGDADDAVFSSEVESIGPMPP